MGSSIGLSAMLIRSCCVVRGAQWAGIDLEVVADEIARQIDFFRAFPARLDSAVAIATAYFLACRFNYRDEIPYRDGGVSLSCRGFLLCFLLLCHSKSRSP